MARFAPMPRARVRTTVRANPGALRSWRTAYGKSCDKVMCLSLGLPVRHYCSGEHGSRGAIVESCFSVPNSAVSDGKPLSQSNILRRWLYPIQLEMPGDWPYNDRRSRLPSIPRHLLKELHVYASGHHQFLVGVGRRRHVGPLR